MIGKDDFRCAIGREFGYVNRVNEGPGAYSELWCPIKLKFISNCDNCERNELEKEMRAGPNNYQEWLRRH